MNRDRKGRIFYQTQSAINFSISTFDALNVIESKLEAKCMTEENMQVYLIPFHRNEPKF